MPTFREASRVEAVVRACAREADEVVVVDAGSDDGTAELARRAGARVVASEKGRGLQLEAGARLAGGDVLVFVHADVLVPEGFRRAIERALEPGVVGGNFRLRFEPPSFWASVFSIANDLRRRFFRIYYGDSCIFVRREAFEALGGFSPIPIFEDYELVRRLERLGETAYVTSPEVAASARRFEGRPMRTLLLWAALQLAYSLGAPPARLARFYADHR